jgi:hypothetical protein
MIFIASMSILVSLFFVPQELVCMQDVQTYAEKHRERVFVQLCNALHEQNKQNVIASLQDLVAVYSHLGWQEEAIKKSLMLIQNMMQEESCLITLCEQMLNLFFDAIDHRYTDFFKNMEHDIIHLMKARKNNNFSEIAQRAQVMHEKLESFKQEIGKVVYIPTSVDGRITRLIQLFEHLYRDPEYYYPIYFEHQEPRKKNQVYGLCDRYLNSFIDHMRQFYFGFAENEDDIQTQFLKLKQECNTSLVSKDAQSAEELLAHNYKENNLWVEFKNTVASLKKMPRCDDMSIVNMIGRFFRRKSDMFVPTKYFGGKVATTTHALTGLTQSVENSIENIKQAIPSDDAIKKEIINRVEPVCHNIQKILGRIQGIVPSSYEIEAVIRKINENKPLSKLAHIVHTRKKASVIVRVEDILKQGGISALLIRCVAPQEDIQQLDEAIKLGIPVGTIFKVLDELISSYGFSAALDGLIQYVKNDTTLDDRTAKCILDFMQKFKGRVELGMQTVHSYVETTKEGIESTVDASLHLKNQLITSISHTQQGIYAITQKMHFVAGNAALQSLSVYAQTQLLASQSSFDLWKKTYSAMQQDRSKDVKTVVQEKETKNNIKKDKNREFLSRLLNIFRQKNLEGFPVFYYPECQDSQDMYDNVLLLCTEQRNSLKEKIQQIEHKFTSFKSQAAHFNKEYKECETEYNSLQNAGFLMSTYFWFMRLLGFDRQKNVAARLANLKEQSKKLDAQGRSLIKELDENRYRETTLCKAQQECQDLYKKIYETDMQQLSTMPQTVVMLEPCVPACAHVQNS